MPGLDRLETDLIDDMDQSTHRAPVWDPWVGSRFASA